MPRSPSDPSTKPEPTILTHAQWTALRLYGYCTVTREQNNRVDLHLRKQTRFPVRCEGQFGELMARVVSEEVTKLGAGEIFFLKSDIQRGD